VFLKKSEGILIVGASEVSQIIGLYLESHDRHVVLIDSNQTNISKATEKGLEAFTTNIYSETLVDNIELNDVGYLMALTGSPDINKYAIDKFGKQFGENGAFRLVSSDEMNDTSNNPKEGLFSHTDDFGSLTETARLYPIIHEFKLKSKEHYYELIEFTNSDNDIIPLFIKDTHGEIEIISSYSKDTHIVEKDYELVYLGKPINHEI